jgi:hypothetical protein
MDDLLIGAEEQKVGKAANVWEKRSRAPPFILPNCKFIICMFDYFEETRHLSLSLEEIQVRDSYRLRLVLRGLLGSRGKVEGSDGGATVPTGTVYR